ncbi:MAG TPA: copper homeostasis membrane protein CopD [Alphaproteobacteria bacterium]|nr:copper homeostasis membrane protein CopD [Alphaproteobacteria bacterium]
MEQALQAVRFLHYAAALQLFGVTVFQAATAPPGLRAVLAVPATRLAAASAWVLLASALLWLMIMAGSMGEGWADAADPGVIGTVLGATGFGRVWAWQLGLAVLLVVLVSVPRLRLWWLLAGLAAGALGSLGLVGHATIGTGGWREVNQASQAVHLMSSGFWIGSLVPLLFCLRQLRRADHAAAADLALRRFSGLGHLAVALVLGSGVVSAVLIGGPGVWRLESAWGLLLAAKVALVLTMIGLAIVNRYVFVPAIAGDGPGLRQLWAGTVAEIVLGAGVLGLVSVLGTMRPSG